MNKKSKEIVKKLCFTLVVVISIITIIGCPNTVSSKANGTSSSGGSTGGGNDPKPDLVKDTIEVMKIKGNNDPIVRDKDGLSFGWRNNKLCLLSTEDLYTTGSSNGDPNYPLDEAFKKIKAEIGDEGVAFIPTSFDSVSDGLKKRWIAAKKTKYTKVGTIKYLEPKDSLSYIKKYIDNKVGLANLKVLGFANTGQYFTVDKNKNIFIVTDDTAAVHFADWHLVFVPKDDAPKDLESYSFHYGPYTLWDKSHPNNQDDPKSLIDVNYNADVHMFTLSDMLKDSLNRIGKGVIADQVVAEFPPLSPKNKDKYDVYLVLGKLYSAGFSTKFGYERVKYSFRNVLKLTDYDDYWKDCWEKDELVKPTSP
ncbi:hypothetical protein HO345_10220 [Treponema denticola]|uniref:hypothetical protein n=1 Tax=Treponema denticola TaxID=158 RepID=UPI0020A34B27|nr:hypothetical protein [Treponema denticola]UTD13330.1 hypothetical protein HO345_10220 [Treponema denticola]